MAPNDAYSVALKWLSAREWSESQLRARLSRRKHDPGDIDAAIARLKQDGTLDDRRVARALARMESGIKHRGRVRVMQKIRQAGIDAGTAEDAVADAFHDLDENALLEQACERRLRGRAPRDLDERSRARVVRALLTQGFALEAILKKLKN